MRRALEQHGAAIILALFGVSCLAYAGGTAPPGRSSSAMAFSGPAGSTVASVSPGARFHFGAATPAGCDLYWDTLDGMMRFTCPVADLGAVTNFAALPAVVLPTCDATEGGRIRVQASDWQVYYCPGAGKDWVPVSRNTPVQVAFTSPAAVGVLGVLGNYTQTVTAARAQAGASCQASCPSSLVAKALVSCSVDAAGALAITYTSKISTTLNLGASACVALVTNP